MDHLCRDVLDETADPVVQLGVGAYFITWAFLSGYILMNIVLAVLVDSFTEAQNAMAAEQVRAVSRRFNCFYAR
jgi:hypothetical protein